MVFKRIVIALAVFGCGLACGGYLFSQSVPRSFLALNDCASRCYTSVELTGLMASALVLRAPALVPNVELESDLCVAIRHPKPSAKFHYVLIPKHDTRNIATLTSDDAPYVMGCFALARRLVERDGLTSYQVYTNGPGRQDVGYLHFHLVANH